MTEAATTPAKHVFLDVVGFTHNRSIEAQSDIVRFLNLYVTACLKRHAIPEDKRILLPTGDGLCIALLNLENPYDIHVKLTLSILEMLHEHNTELDLNEQRKFEVRIGISENKDNLVQDVNGRQNIAGAGINEAQRVMSLADGSQVLVAQSVYNILRYREPYMGAFKQYSAKIKHGESINVFQLKKEHPFLNTEVPSTFRAPPKQEPVKSRMPRLMAYYLAHAAANQKTILEGKFYSENAVTLLLFLRAVDSEEQADATALDSVYPRTYKSGTASFAEQYEYYAKIDSSVRYTLDRLLAENYFYQWGHEYFHHAAGGWTDFRFASTAGKLKLKEDWPQIYMDFYISAP